MTVKFSSRGFHSHSVELNLKAAVGIQLCLTAHLSEPTDHGSVCVADASLFPYRVNLVLLVLLELLVPAVLL